MMRMCCSSRTLLLLAMFILALSLDAAKTKRRSKTRAPGGQSFSTPLQPEATGSHAAGGSPADEGPADFDTTCKDGDAGACRKSGRVEGVRELVSVVTPTRGKTQKWHPLLYQVFASQTYDPKELIVLDSSKRPSKFFLALQDKRVYYLHVANTTLGVKRNRLASMANGTIIAQFDDDDWYAPTYLDVMVSRLHTSKADFVKLSGWFVYSCTLKFFGYFDPAETAIFGMPCCC
jgi:hypothetical protein